MWKLILGFIVFAALALFILSHGGDIDMSGEKHDVGASHSSEPAASAASAAPAPAAASAALPASAASQ
jgi:hypothetical protein